MKGRASWVIFALAVVGLLFGQPSSAEENLPPEIRSQVDYLNKEGARIAKESKRIEGEANRLRSEADRLGSEHTRLLSVAAALDAKWLQAKEAAPETVQDYPGRNRSQRIIRGDAARISLSIQQLQTNAVELDDEANRLRHLSADVFELIKKVRDGADKPQPKTDDLSELRKYIRAKARTLSVKWEPA